MDEILKYLIGATGISTILIFLGKLTLNFLRDIGLEKYKNELDKQAIKFKSELDTKLEKFRISYSNVFVEQVKIIKETYKKLIQAEKPLEYLLKPIKIGPIQSDEDVATEVVEKANELFNYYNENEIVFSEKSNETFSQIRKKYFEVWNTYSRKQFLGENISGELLIKLANDMQEAYEKKLQVEIQELKKSLKKEFQKQLGIIEVELNAPLKNEIES